jgi:hypothetical protein
MERAKKCISLKILRGLARYDTLCYALTTGDLDEIYISLKSSPAAAFSTSFERTRSKGFMPAQAPKNIPYLAWAACLADSLLTKRIFLSEIVEASEAA